MWARSDVLQLLQLLTMIVLAMVQAAWCLLIHQVNMRWYAALTRPIEKEFDVAATTVEVPKIFKEIDVPV
ncbi:hypothetical protein HBI56_081930 [Parastagonospora nodorum]|uniref:Uncharacterized protein n=2 Tax=Phaeosphaeria nodorum (strain SN15 / ATCC MYA-4574 / FGSC 10173) TaxID=321614 RepID=A0A7U2I7B1_PHANO|nr:hypothetical protein SNOG_10636 [Parastagonospora nodorum SN15]KAH3913559.1 hypothetical protein HBH56_104640 [Parastagonospora nodorum]EAT82030.1 hypothetical protein SNOG_10636 [Parastagonospora nodorum SN15]KAH3929296.1 hypothetical protein HBH54_125770 [Parastagonospora nodorum]KAH3951747.1 hypothetical protein HBH53_059770 [Parastagonospora nodorum]KAH3975610.1 hypothetical protein HBH52_127080 [Parastagonospora nodorum]